MKKRIITASILVLILAPLVIIESKFTMSSDHKSENKSLSIKDVDERCESFLNYIKEKHKAT